MDSNAAAYIDQVLAAFARNALLIA